MDIDEFAHAVSVLFGVRRLVTLTLRQGLFTSMQTTKVLAVPLRQYS